MDRDDKIGKGRGAFLLEMMKQKRQEARPDVLAHSLETPSISSAETSSFERQALSQSQTSSFSSSNVTGRGRAQLISTLIKSQSSNVQESRGPSSRASFGRGSLLSSLTKNVGSNGSTTSLPFSKLRTSIEEYGVLEKLADISMYDSQTVVDVPSSKNTAPICRQGKSGIKIEAYANFIDLNLESGKGLFQYEVKYSPDIDSRPLRTKLLNQHSVELGRTKTFDGATLYLPKRLPQDKTYCKSEHPMDGSEVTLVIIYKKQESMSENIQFFNVLLNRIMRALRLVRINRQNFNPNCPYKLEKHKLEIWPGYVTAINEYEGGLKLCLDAKHRVMRTETVRDLMCEILGTKQPNSRDIAAQQLVGLSVLTRYNNKTYRIDDIAWNKSPQYVFLRNEEQMSLIQYYKQQWSIDIKDLKQPLLVHRAKIKTSTGETQEKTILLVPELCYITGLTDTIRNNHMIMKDLSEVTKMSPEHRRDEIRRFLEEIKKNSVTQQLLSEWGLHLADDLIRFPARQLGSETIIFRDNRNYTLDKSSTEWSNAVTKNPVLNTPNLNNWYIFYCMKDESCVTQFLQMLQKISKAIGMCIKDPRKIALPNDRTETYHREVQKSILADKIELVVIVFPTNRGDKYSMIKKLCCVQNPMPSQVIIAKTISKPPKLKSITEKIALQINCKIGGSLWTLNLPLVNCMVCGIDVYHGGIGAGVKKSAAGFVASLDAKLSKWHSRVCFQSSRQELVDILQTCFISAINAFHKHNGCNPDRILIFRDGVGDGDLDYVENYEVKQLLLSFGRIAPNYKPQLSVIIVQKRINTRLFIAGPRGNLDNPRAGTVIDSCVTRRNYYDFFLVPQNVRQGTVTPAHYIVLYDSSNMEVDHMQRLTYKLCHLYYNWAGTIRIPAPCQYAHKLVYLVGQSMDSLPHRSLSDQLFYL